MKKAADPDESLVVTSIHSVREEKERGSVAGPSCSVVADLTFAQCSVLYCSDRAPL